MKCMIKEDFSCWAEKDRCGVLLPQEVVAERLKVPKDYVIVSIDSDSEEIVSVRAIKSYVMGEWESDNIHDGRISKNIHYSMFKELFPEVDIKEFYAQKLFKKEGKYYSSNESQEIDFETFFFFEEHRNCREATITPIQ